MSNRTPLKYVLVQHSAWGYAEDPTFKGGLEIRGVTDRRDLKKAEDLGVPIYESYGRASKAEHEFMYPPEVGGLIPRADTQGSFARATIDGLHIFIPTEAARERVRALVEAP